MSLLFNRKTRVTFYGDEDDELLVVEDLRIRFELNKTLLGYPARGKLEIYNLSESNIARISQRLTKVRVEAGYVDLFGEIFNSNIMNYYKSRFTTDSVFTMILAGEAAAWENSTFSRTYEAGVMPATILRDLAGSFEDIIVGSLLESAEWEAKLASVTHVGAVKSVLNKLAVDYNFDWSLHNGQLDIIPRGRVLEDKPTYIITPETGLIGSPTLTELGADFRILLNPDIMLGRQCQMSTEYVELGQAGLEFRKVRNTADGFYKVMDLRYIGDSHGNEWYCDIIGWIVGNEPRK